MTDLDVSGLRAKAEAATPGPWLTWDDGDVGTAYPVTKRRRGEAVTVESEHIANTSSPNAEHIAAWSPDTALALLDRLADAEKEAAMRRREVADMERDNDRLEARLERAEKVIEDVMVSHRPAHPVFNWALGLRYDEPCPDCNGKAGVHECGCWADEDIEFVCRECDDSKGGKSRREVPWPCDVARILSGYEKDGAT